MSGRRRRPVAVASVVGRRRKRTLEGVLEGSPLADTLLVSAAFVILALVAESTTAFVSPMAGVLVHCAILVSVVTHAALIRRINVDLSNILVAVAPLPIIRIASLTTPVLQFSYLQWFAVLGVVLFGAIVASIRLLKAPLAEIGLRWPAARHVPLEVATVLAGFAFGWIEYQVLRPGPLVAEISLQTLVAPVLVLYMSTGLLEELLFRGVIQRYGLVGLGTVRGIAFTALLFAFFHIGWHSWLDLVFVGAVGLCYSLVVRRTGSIVGVSISHAITNSMLFLVMPLLDA